MIDAVCLAGKSGDRSSIPHVTSLLDREYGQVRYYALCSLVLDLDQKHEQIALRCSAMMRRDGDDNVRSMAAACLGSIYSGSKRRDVFLLLKSVLASEEEPLVKRSAYDALFNVLGHPPIEWPSLRFRKRQFDNNDIDWPSIAALEIETIDNGSA